MTEPLQAHPNEAVLLGSAPPSVPVDSAASLLVGSTVGQVEKELILLTLIRCNGNRTHAADMLGISLRTLRNKINQYGSRGVAIPPAS